MLLFIVHSSRSCAACLHLGGAHKGALQASVHTHASTCMHTHGQGLGVDGFLQTLSILYLSMLGRMPASRQCMSWVLGNTGWLHARAFACPALQRRERQCAVHNTVGESILLNITSLSGSMARHAHTSEQSCLCCGAGSRTKAGSWYACGACSWLCWAGGAW